MYYKKDQTHKHYNCEMSDGCLRNSFPIGETVETTGAFRKSRERFNKMVSEPLPTHETGKVVGYSKRENGKPVICVCTDNGINTFECQFIKVCSCNPIKMVRRCSCCLKYQPKG